MLPAVFHILFTALSLSASHPDSLMSQTDHKPDSAGNVSACFNGKFSSLLYSEIPHKKAFLYKVKAYACISDSDKPSYSLESPVMDFMVSSSMSGIQNLEAGLSFEYIRPRHDNPLKPDFSYALDAGFKKQQYQCDYGEIMGMFSLQYISLMPKMRIEILRGVADFYTISFILGIRNTFLVGFSKTRSNLALLGVNKNIFPKANSSAVMGFSYKLFCIEMAYEFHFYLYRQPIDANELSYYSRMPFRISYDKEFMGFKLKILIDLFGNSY